MKTVSRPTYLSLLRLKAQAWTGYTYLPLSAVLPVLKGYGSQYDGPTTA